MDTSNKSSFTDQDVTLENTQVAYQGFFKMLKYTLKHRLFNGGWSKNFSRELFVRGDAAAAILYDPKADQIGYVEQFRVGAMAAGQNPWCLEVVAGMIDKGETGRSTIERELVEEADFYPAEIIEIGSYLSTPGGCDERVWLYCALGDLSKIGGVHGLDDENEDIRVHVESAETVLNRIFTDRFNNAATVIALQWLALNRARLIEAHRD
ncbi:NUDIX domain-containing protein [Sessilibacter sp. MAH2]